MEILSRRQKRCADCGADISRRGNRAQRCQSCQASHEATQERERYHEQRDTISTRRILERQGASEYVAPRNDEVIDYTTADQVPQFRQLSSRQNPRHDHATRVRQQHAMELADEGESEMVSWDQLVGRHAEPDTRASFPAPMGSPAFVGGSSFRGGREVRLVDFPDVAGIAYAPRPVVNNGRNGHLVQPWR
jgi:hypothetical protein